MKFKINNKYFRWGLTAFIVLASAIGFYYFIFHSHTIKSNIQKTMKVLMPVLVGMGIAYLLTPILNYMEKNVILPLCDHFRIRKSQRRDKVVRGIGILITMLLFIGTIYVLVYMLVSQIVPSVQNVIKNFESYRLNLMNWLNGVLEDNPDLGSFLTNSVAEYSAELENWLKGLLPDTLDLLKKVSIGVFGVLGVVLNCIIGLVISIYVLASKDRFAGQAKKIAYAVFEQDVANTVVSNFRFTHRTFVGFLSGKIADSTIIGLLCFIGTTLMQTPYAALVSVVIGFTNVIPFFGPFLGAIPCGILIFMMNPMAPLKCVYFLLFILFLQQVDGNIIGPKILGNSTGLTGFWVIFAITLFGGIFGVLGMVIGVPAFAVIYAAVRAAVHTALRKKQLPTERTLYDDLEYIDADGFHKLEEPKRHSGERKARYRRGSNEKKDKENEVSDTESK